MSSDCVSNMEAGELCTEIYNEENRPQPEVCSSSPDKLTNETTTTEMTSVTGNVSSKSAGERMVKNKFMCIFN